MKKVNVSLQLRNAAIRFADLRESNLRRDEKDREDRNREWEKARKGQPFRFKL